MTKNYSKQNYNKMIAFVSILYLNICGNDQGCTSLIHSTNKSKISLFKSLLFQKSNHNSTLVFPPVPSVSPITPIFRFVE